MKTNWGKKIFLWTGPVIYFGFVLPMMASVNLDKIGFIALSILGLSTLYFLISLTVLNVLQSVLFPVLRERDLFDFHAKNSAIYALMTGIPATYLGAFNIAMAYGCPGGKPEFDVVGIVLLCAYGWGIGATAGIIASAFLLPFLLPIKQAFSSLFTK
ncbi:MAG: hypothetical protein KIT34_10635 [Cyanobacteria bacterium TGS_CYA1]|nr:hypothetical protein [Cyanobacteria bacterium TGS_CYA1]